MFIKDIEKMKSIKWINFSRDYTYSKIYGKFQIIDIIDFSNIQMNNIFKKKIELKI